MISRAKLIVFVLSLGFATQACGNDNFERAVVACTKRQYNVAISQLALVEKEVGQSTPRVESLRVHALVGLQDWVQAKIALNRYKRLAPNATSPAHQALLKLEPQIDAGVAQLEAKWKSEAAKRVEAELKQLREAEENSRKSAEAALRARAPAVERLQKSAQAAPEPEFVAPMPVDPSAPTAPPSPPPTAEKALQLLADRRALLAWFAQPKRDPQVEDALSSALLKSSLNVLGFDPNDMLLRPGRRLLFGLTRDSSGAAPEVVTHASGVSPGASKREYQPDLWRVAGTGSGVPMPERLADFSQAGDFDYLRFERVPGRYRDRKTPRGVVARGALWIGGVPDRLPLIELAVFLKRGHELTHLSLHYDQWHASFSVPPPELGLSFKLNQPAPVSQYVLTGERFPAEETRRLAGEGYLLRDLHYAGNQWIVILTKLPEANLVSLDEANPQPDDSLFGHVTAGTLEAALRKLQISFLGKYSSSGTRAIDSIIKIQAHPDGREWAILYERSMRTLKTTQLLMVDDHADPLLKFMLRSGFRINFAVETKDGVVKPEAIPSEVTESEPEIIRDLNNVYIGFTTPWPIEPTAVIYPAGLKQNGVSGSAKIRYKVSPKGVVSDEILMETTHPEFGKAALEGVRGRQYFPAIATDFDFSSPVTLEQTFRFGAQ